MKIKKLLTILGITGVLVVLAGCGQTEQVDVEQPLKNVTTITAGKTDVLVQEEFAAEIISQKQSNISPKVAGRVTAVYTDIGSRVNKGDLLFTIEATEYSQSINQAQLSYDQSKLSYDDAKINYDKLVILYQEGAISKQELDSAETRYLSAKEQFNTAEANLALTKKNGGLSENSSSDENSRVYAPVSGIVSAKNINVGELASSATPAITIMDISSLLIQLNVSEKIVTKLSMGKQLEFTMDNISDKTFKTQITNISPSANQAGFYTVKAKLLDSNSVIKPGMFAKVKITTHDKKDVLALPNHAIVNDKGLQFVYIVKDGAVEKKLVKIGIENDKLTEILEGIEVGDTVITEGQNFLYEGEKVKM